MSAVDLTRQQLLVPATRVAWVSRHRPVPAQIRELQAKLGEVALHQIPGAFKDAEEVYREVRSRGCGYACVVLPMGMIMKLVEHKDVVWLWSEMETLHDCYGKDLCQDWDPERDVHLRSGDIAGRHMRFKRFMVIKAVKLELEEW